MSLFLLQHLQRHCSGPLTFDLLSYNRSLKCASRNVGVASKEHTLGPVGGNAANHMGNEQPQGSFQWTIDLLMSSGSRRATLEVNWCCGSIRLQQEALQPLIKSPPPPLHLAAGWRRSCTQLICHPLCYFPLNYSDFILSVNFSIKFVFYKIALFSSWKFWPDVCLQALFPNSACCCCSRCCCCIFKNRSGVVFWLRATKLLLLCFFLYSIFFSIFSSAHSAVFSSLQGSSWIWIFQELKVSVCVLQ